VASLDRYMTVDERMDSDIGFTYICIEWFRDKGILS
jgi:hypothetical protein